MRKRDLKHLGIASLILLAAIVTASGTYLVAPGQATGRGLSPGQYDARFNGQSDWRLEARPIILTADLAGGGCRQTTVGRSLQIGPFIVEHWY